MDAGDWNLVHPERRAAADRMPVPHVDADRHRENPWSKECQESGRLNRRAASYLSNVDTLQA